MLVSDSDRPHTGESGLTSIFPAMKINSLEACATRQSPPAINRCFPSIVERAAQRFEAAGQAGAHDGALIGFGGAFRESGLDVPVGHSASAKIARDPERSLLSQFGAQANELARVAGVVQVVSLLQLFDDAFDH